jgi:leader peptidase (prepilin peptidase)/N-methyltransferase
MHTLMPVFFFLLGLTFGSFFNVVGLRLPKNEPFGSERSYCPACKKQLAAVELIPVFSYIVQKGKCRNCQKSISFMYPAIEFLTGILFMHSYIYFGLEWELITALLLMSMLMILLVTDISYMLIPNKVLLFFLPLFVIMRMIHPLEPWWYSLAGAALGFGLLFIVILLSKGGMGGGDLKLFAVLGVLLGPWGLLLSFFLSCLFGAVIGMGLIIFKVIRRREPIPFGPYIVTGTIITYFYGENIIQWYVTFL